MGYYKAKRFDVAGMHPDEAWRAVSNMHGTVEEMRRQFLRGPDLETVNKLTWQYLQIENRPMRFGNTPDAEVQRYLARGVELIDQLKTMMPLGLSRGQQQVRDRCAEMAKSMRKVLDKRPDEAMQPQIRIRPRQRM